MMILRRLLVFVSGVFGLIIPIAAQNSGTVTNKLLGTLNAIQTTVPF